ncbi:Ras GTPase-activating protein 1 [Thoreauomyces humboldtii]|nr:Ras GTPase-activating protein 1 [Thoreauomyces humboldtii]
MGLSTIAGYAEESTRQCRELVAFWKRRQEIEHEYGTALVLNTSGPVSADSFRAQLLGTSLWTAAFDAASQLQTLAEAHIQEAAQLQRNVIDPMHGHLREMKAMRRTHQDRGRELTQQLQDVYTECRRAKQDYDKAQIAAVESVDSLSKAQLRADRRKDLERLQSKATSAIERVTIAEEVLRNCEEHRAAAQQEHFEVQIPTFYQEVLAYEDKRLSLIRKGLNDVASIDCVDVNSRFAVLTGIQDMISSIDLRKDITAFETHHLTNDSKDFNQASVRGMVGAMKAGRASVKRGDNSAGWSQCYLALMAEDMLLYCFDSEDSEQPREVITLSASQVYSLDDSYFGRAHCFQLILDTEFTAAGSPIRATPSYTNSAHSSSSITYNFIAESANDKHEWIQCIRKFAYCCKACHASGELNKGAGIPSRSLGLWVMEAKDLKVAGTNTSNPRLNPFCVVLLNDVKQARTSVKKEDAPFWGEEFAFQDIPPCQTRLRLLFFSGATTRLGKDLEVGYVSINLTRLKANRKIEEWYQIRPFHRDDSLLAQGHMGSVRIAYQLSNERSLPMPLYSELLETVTEPPLTCVQFIGAHLDKPQPREVFAKTVLNILVAFDRDVAGVQVLTRKEIESTSDPNIMFRGNSIATKILDQYMKMVAEGYLHATLQSLIRGVYTSKESCEVDPSRLPPGKESEQLKRNWKRLLNHATIFWEAIQRSAEKCPPELVHVFSDMIQAAEAKFERTVKYAAVSGFIFLRFFCPAILSPKLFGIMTEHPPDPSTARTLTLLAKIMQNLANLSEFEGKEPHMSPANAWINSHLHEMKGYIHQISSSGDNRAMSVKPRIDLRRESAVLHQCINAIWGDLQPAIEALRPIDDAAEVLPTANDPLFNLIPIIEKLNEASEQQAHRSSDNYSQSAGALDEDSMNESSLPRMAAASYDPNTTLAMARDISHFSDEQLYSVHQTVGPDDPEYEAGSSYADACTLRSTPGTVSSGLNLRAGNTAVNPVGNTHNLLASDSVYPHSMQDGILSNALSALHDDGEDEYHLAPSSPMNSYTEAGSSSWKQKMGMGSRKKRDAPVELERGRESVTDRKGDSASTSGGNLDGSSVSQAQTSTTDSTLSARKTTKNLFNTLRGAKVGEAIKAMLAGGGNASSSIGASSSRGTVGSRGSASNLFIPRTGSDILLPQTSASNVDDPPLVRSDSENRRLGTIRLKQGESFNSNPTDLEATAKTVQTL